MVRMAHWLAAALLLSSLQLAGCQTSDVIPPTVELGAATSQRPRWNGTLFSIAADIVNRDKNTVVLESADYTLTVGENRIATGSAHPRVTIGPGVTATTFPIDINYFRMLEASRKRRDLILPTNQIQATLTGVVVTRSGWTTQETPFERSVTIPLNPESWNGEFPSPRMIP